MLWATMRGGLLRGFAACALALACGSESRPQEGVGEPAVYFESFEDPLGQDLTIDGPGGLSSQPCPEGASRSAPGCARGRREVVPAAPCPTDRCALFPLCEQRFDNDWHVHTSATPDRSGTGKAFVGQNSLHFGRHVFSATGRPADTYRLEVTNAFVGPDLNLARQGAPILSFWHIAEFCDTDCWAFLPDTGDDFGIVEIRVDGNRRPDVTSWSPWQRVSPHFGAYDGTQDTLYTSPTYEPSDDINPERPDDPLNTMCLPNTVFLSQGSARGTDPQCGDGDGNGFPDCGHGPLEDDPGLRTPDRVSSGETGVGVWVQSEIDLSGYAGRHIQYRFVATTLNDNVDAFVSYAENYGGGPPAISELLDIDDGWYIDSISVTDTVPLEPPRRGRRR